LPEVALSTMWAKDRFDDMAEFAAEAKEFGFSHVEINASVSPQGLSELVETSIPISSIHSPSPAVLSSRGVPVANLSLSSLEANEREEAVSFAVEGGLVGYWHDVGHAEVNQRLGFTPHEEWLSRFGDRMIGIHLHDVLGIRDHRPPGKGDVNWNMVAEYVPQEALKVCEIAEWNEAEQIRGVVDFLQKQGILD